MSREFDKIAEDDVLASISPETTSPDALPVHFLFKVFAASIIIFVKPVCLVLQIHLTTTVGRAWGIELRHPWHNAAQHALERLASVTQTLGSHPARHSTGCP